MTTAAAFSGRHVLGGVAAISAGVVAGAAIAAAQAVAGPLAALLLVAGCAAAALVTRPVVALGVLLVVTVFAEADSEAMFGFTEVIYQSVGGLPVSPVILLTGIVTVAVATAVRRDDVRDLIPTGLSGPLLLLAGATLPAAITGYTSGVNPFLILSELVGLGTLLLVPPLAAWVLRRHDAVHTAVAAATGLAGLKAVEGLTSWILGAGRPLGSTTITFYEPAPLWLLVLALTGSIAAALTRTVVPPWTRLVALGSLLCLALSLRRGFWVGATLSVVLCILVASGRRGRALIVPAAMIVAVAGIVAFRAADAPERSNVAVERARSVTPSRLAAGDDDRYRLQEQANIRAEIVRRPITGIGLGAEWRGRVPLSIEHEGGRRYAHVVALWYWMKLGLLGVVAYGWLIVSAVRMGGVVWRRHPKPVVRVAGLAVAVGMLCIAVVEATASFTGVSPRFTILFAGVLGWLAVAGDEARRGRSAAEAAT